VRFYTPRRVTAFWGKRGVRLLVPVLCVLAAMLGAVAPAFAGLTHVYQGLSFGEEGSGPGQLSQPTGLAVNDATGDVYVVDAGNKRVEQFTAAGTFVREFAPPGGFTEPGSIAVDDSSNPLDVSKEDVYVTDTAANAIDKFEANGHFLGSIHEAGAGVTLLEMVGVAVDDEGHLWVSTGCSRTLSEFSAAEPNVFVATQVVTTAGCLRSGLGVDSEGDFWVIQRYAGYGAKLSPTGAVLTPPGQEVGGAGHHGLAVDPTTNSVYLSSASDVVEYSAAGSEMETFGAGHLSEVEAESEPIAIDPVTDTADVADVAADAIRVFPGVVLPIATSKPANGLAHEGDATLNATVNPEGVALNECKFEYGASSSYENSVPCSQTPAEIGSGTSAVAVSANLTGLAIPSEYHYRLVTTNTNGEAVSHDETFIAPDKPEILYPKTSAPSSSEALITGYLNPGGLATTYHVDYGTTEAYGSSTPEASLGNGLALDRVRIEVRGLSPATTYHARLVAHNALGTTEEPLTAFSTPGTLEASSGLPDDRGYELVSPASFPGEVYVPDVRAEYEVVSSDRPALAATNGEAVTYAGDPTATAGSGAQGFGTGDQFIAHRQSNGWTATDITPNTEVITNLTPFEAFSPNLTAAVYHENAGYPPPASETTPAGCQEGLYGYSQETATFSPLFTTTLTPGQCGEPRFAGASESWNQVFFQDEAPLVAGTRAFAQVAGSGCFKQCNLYDTVSAAMRVVNVLPDGVSTAGGVFGGVNLFEGGGSYIGANPDAPKTLSDVVSSDGGLAFWTDTEAGSDEGHIFVRVNPGRAQSSLSAGICTESEMACTVAVSLGAASYLTATPDGRYVFYLEAGGLWRYDTGTGARAAIADASATVRGLLGVSSDGESVYFVADGALTGAPGPSGEVAHARICETGFEQREKLQARFEAGEITEQENYEGRAVTGNEEEQEKHDGLPPAHTGCNLYLWHSGTTAYVGDLSPRDDDTEGRISGGGNTAHAGDWQLNVGQHTASVTPDGAHTVFESARMLTDSDVLGESELGGLEAYREIYMYDAGPVPHLACVSCRPNDAAPALRGQGIEKNQLGTFLPAGSSESSAPRWVSEDGSRVFFDSDQQLVSDEPGSEQGVYEWEREGTGTCSVVTPARRDGGCISLLSGTGSTHASYFVEADPSGDNVFIDTLNQLTAQGTGERMMLYDVRVGGGFAESSQACTGTGCQGVPPAGAVFATPPSATFSGSANFAAQPIVKPKAKVLTAKARLAVALRVCRRDHKLRVRERCERKARETYRHATHRPAAKKSTTKGHHHA
jgi:NHL repeat